jgi:hypothetical protein
MWGARWRRRSDGGIAGGVEGACIVDGLLFGLMWRGRGNLTSYEFSKYLSGGVRCWVRK